MKITGRRAVLSR